MKQLSLTLILLFSLFTYAQKGTVKGTISDKDLNNEPLPFANVNIKGSTTGTTTDENGVYTLSLAPGNYTLVYSFVGYESQEKPVTVIAGETTPVDVALGSGGYTLQDVVIQTQVSRQKETALLLDQKNAVEMKSSIGAQELSRKGVGDVATAVTKTSGITKQEGSGSIYVRGLGDRYNSTSLNGLPVASNDPEKKNIELEIFPTDIVEYVSIDKVYNSRMYGDFAGGNVDIISKDYTGKGFFNLEIGSSVNSNAISRNSFYLPDGSDFFGFGVAKTPNTLSQFQFENSLNPQSAGPVGGSLALEGGNSWAFGSESRINLFATASFANDYMSFEDGLNRSVNAEGVPTRDFFDYQNLQYTTRTTGMVNLGYKINNRNKLSYNVLFINSSSMRNEEFKGLILDIANENNGFLRRGTFIKNALLVNQLLGQHTLSDRSKLNWGLSHNLVSNDIPDRMQTTLRLEQDGYVFANNSESDNHRYFQNLTENEVAANLTADYQFSKTGEGDYKGRIVGGLNGRMKQRSLEAAQFNFGISPGQSQTVVDPMNLDAFFTNDNYNAGFFTISTFRGPAEVPNALKPQTYDGDQVIFGGFGNVEYKFSDRWTAIAGVKGEYIYQSIEWQTQIDPLGNDDEFDKVAVLPNLTVKYTPNDRHNFRFAASKTYTLPQFKERAFFVYEDVTVKKIGNPDLYPSDNYNLDLKWEFFPKNDEIVSLGFFGKYIQNPINEITIASATDDISYVNIGDFGYVGGVELEVRKTLYAIDGENDNRLSAGLNASYMHTNQELNEDKIRRETNNRINAVFNTDKESFTGASDLLVNADVSYVKEWDGRKKNITATVAYNYFSDRLFSIGTNERGNLVDKAVGTFDIILKSKLSEKLGIGLTGRNLLNPSIDRVQENRNGDAKVLSYKKGLFFGLNINYTL